MPSPSSRFTDDHCNMPILLSATRFWSSTPRASLSPTFYKTLARMRRVSSALRPLDSLSHSQSSTTPRLTPLLHSFNSQWISSVTSLPSSPAPPSHPPSLPFPKSRKMLPSTASTTSRAVLAATRQRTVLSLELSLVYCTPLWDTSITTTTAWHLSLFKDTSRLSDQLRYSTLRSLLEHFVFGYIIFSFSVPLALHILMLYFKIVSPIWSIYCQLVHLTYSVALAKYSGSV